MRRRSGIALVIFALVLAVGGLSLIFRERLTSLLFKPTVSNVTEVQVNQKAIETVAANLDTPWSITFLPEGDMLVTERSGQVKRIGQQGKVYPISGVRETSEGGLLGIALHPDFESNARLYIYLTTETNGTLTNQIDQYTFTADSLKFDKRILTGIPAASNHNGGAIAFGPDKKLYVTTGDAAQQDLAQDRNSLAGKILRMNDDGTTPGDNPFNNLVWSYGHRNPQGIAWDKDGRLWSVEHGPSGTASGRDEINRIGKGENYGWAVITGDETREGMRSPVSQSGDNETWAPAGLAWVDGKFYFAGLRGQSLYQVTPKQNDKADLSRYFTSRYGRLRAVTFHDGMLYVSTSNKDGRGTPAADDDKILKIDPKQL